MALWGVVESVVGRRVVVVERREVGRWEEVATGTAIAGAYIWGMLSRGGNRKEGGLWI